jgi:hemerythrin superfamily protein
MQGDVVDIIMNDHRELERIFDELMSKPETRPGLVPVMITLLGAHSRAEESEVYPAAKDAGGEEDVEHSQKEHLEADQLAAQVAETDPTSDEFTGVLQKLIDAVMHHVEEEEEKVLPGMRERLDDSRRQQLGEAFLASRKEHLGEMPEDMTMAVMLQQAKNAGIPVPSGSSKEQVKKLLEENAEE